MPRRHHRFVEDLPPIPDELTAGPPHQTRRDIEREAIAKTAICVWPTCNTTVSYLNGKRTPLCLPHVVELTWEAQHAHETRKPLTEHQLNRELAARTEARTEREERERRGIAPGWIYYARVTDRIKIGYSTDVRQRMRAYPPHAELLAVHPGTPDLERQIHKNFVGSLTQGREWFRPDPRLLAHIDTVLEQFGQPPSHFHYRFRDANSGQATRLRARTRRRRR